MSRRNESPYIVGVDPGAKGGMACLRVNVGTPPTCLFVEDLPYLDGRLDVRQFIQTLDDWGTHSAVYLEKAQVMPAKDGSRNSNSSMFAYGVSYGLLLGSLVGLGIPVHEVHPNTWKKGMGLSKDKAASVALARQTFPTVADRFLKSKDGRAEAALIALYGCRQWGALAA